MRHNELVCMFVTQGIQVENGPGFSCHNRDLQIPEWTLLFQ